MRTTRFLSALAIFLFLFTSSKAAVYYNVIELPISAEGINNVGQIAGYVDSNAVVYDSVTRSITRLGTLPGANGSFATAINNKGQVVGAAEWWGTGVYHAVLFDSTGRGRNIDLGLIAGRTSGEPVCISDNGSIVGTAYNYYSGTFWDDHAVLFDSTGHGNNIDLGTLGGYASSALSVNNNRQVVGTAWDAFGNIKAVLFDTTGQGNNIDLGRYNVENEHSCAYSINNKGQIAGISTYGTATIFDKTAQANIDLGTFDNGTFSMALENNNRGRVVGTATDANGTNKAVVFDSKGTGDNIDLNALINPRLGVILYYAFAINDNGWILCEGSLGGDYYSPYKEYLLIPAVAAPTRLKAVYSTASQIQLSWTDNATNEQGFYIERSANGKTGWTCIAAVAARSGTGTVVYTNTNLKRKTKYFYRVQAYNPVGAGPYSNYISAATK